MTTIKPQKRSVTAPHFVSGSLATFAAIRRASSREQFGTKKEKGPAS
jgi:hypothetical protein